MGSIESIVMVGLFVVGTVGVAALLWLERHPPAQEPARRPMAVPPPVRHEAEPLPAPRLGSAERAERCMVLRAD